MKLIEEHGYKTIYRLADHETSAEFLFWLGIAAAYTGGTIAIHDQSKTVVIGHPDPSKYAGKPVSFSLADLI